MDDFVVIGSGPSGVAAAWALLAQGHLVTLVDVGLKLEPERQLLVDQFASQSPEGWNRETLAPFSEGADADAKGLALKRLFGSDFPYREASESLRASIPPGTLKPSFALGGLSNVWGAVVMPYNARDLERWPILAADLAPHYRAVGDFLPMIAVEDDLSAEHPIHVQNPQPTRPSRQTTHALSVMERRKGRLDRAGIRFGQARVAMRALECRVCGQCLQGCPYDLIYNAAQTVETLRKNPRFRYRPGLIVRSVAEQGDRVIVKTEDQRTGALQELEASRCFLGAGVLGTARIVLESLGWQGRSFRMIDSQYNVLPLLAFHPTRGVEREPLHTLCQMFLEISDPTLSRHNIHCQLYTYNDLFASALGKLGRGWVTRFPGARSQLLGRLMVALCYLHSDDSGTIEVRLEADGEGKPGRLVVKTNPSSRSASLVRRLAWKLFRNAPALGFVAASPAVHTALPGRGFHTGGTFPMRQTPGETETDPLGRLPAFRRVHLVDASIFPTIPATTITYTVMANAHRIASSIGASP